MDSWEKLNETSIPPREASYRDLNFENTADKDYEQVKKIWKVFRIKNRGKYHDLYVKCDTLLLADVFENFRDKCIEIFELDPVYFLSALGIAWETCLKKTEVELELITDYDMLLMVEKRISGGICQAAYKYAKANKYL